MAATLELEQLGRSAARHSEPSEDLSTRFGALVVLEYAMNLFGESPKELFSRIDVLAVLDGVKNDRELFPEPVVAMWDRIKTAGRTHGWTRPRNLDRSARLLKR